MSAGTVVADEQETVTARRHAATLRERVPVQISLLLRRDLFGVQVGVLLLILPILLVTLGLQLTGRQGWNHPPDSRYYLPMMSRDMGHSWAHSIHLDQLVSPQTHVAPWYFADDNQTWQMVRTRILYPVLSIPFIHLWGLSGGSMAIPVLGTVLFLWTTARVLQRLYGPAITVIVAVGFSLTAPVNGFTWAGTDTLAMGLAAVLVANLPIRRRIGRANLVWLGAASVFIALTRQVGVLAPAMAGAGWLWALVRERSWRNRWTGSLVVTAATTLVTQVLSMTLANANTAGVIGHGQTTYWGMLRQFVHYLKIVTQEGCTYMWHHDRILYALLIAAGVSLVARFSSDATAVFVGAVCATYVITAGVGFSSYMRYEMVMFPAAAVAAGQVVQLAIGGYLPEQSADTDVADSALPPQHRTRRWSPAFLSSLTTSAVGRYLGLDRPRRDRWKPQLFLNSAVLATVVGITLQGSWSSTVDAPASPSYAAAQGGTSYAQRPLATPPAEQSLRLLFDQAADMTHDKIMLGGALDWSHPLRYRPTAPDQPGWSTRGNDGTTVITASSLGEDRDSCEAFGRAISLNGTVDPGTIKILSRRVSEYGQDVVFTVQDRSGGVHRGTATTLYPIWDKKDPGIVTSFVFDA